MLSMHIIHPVVGAPRSPVSPLTPALAALHAVAVVGGSEVVLSPPGGREAPSVAVKARPRAGGEVARPARVGGLAVLGAPPFSRTGVGEKVDLALSKKK